MRLLKKISAVLMIVMLLVGSVSVRTLYADDNDGSEDIYTLTRYNNSTIVRPDGTTVTGNSYCLDYKHKTPGGNGYTRVPLSSFDNYSDDIKARLAKLVVYRDEILDYYFNVYDINAVLDTERDYVLGNIDSLSITSGISDADSFDSSAKGHLGSNRYTIQALVWAVVHDDYDAYVHDDNVDGHSDHYRFIESTYYYNSEDPLNDEHSLWNIYYQPGLDYIDTLDNPLDNGIDIWVYIAQDSSYQNVLGAVITYTEVDISKVDEDGNALSGASLQLLDWNGNVVSDWVSDDNVHHVTGIYPGMEYILHEADAPDGYEVSSDISFRVGEDGVVGSATGTITNNTLVMFDDVEVTDSTTTTTTTDETTTTQTSATADAAAAVTTTEQTTSTSSDTQSAQRTGETTVSAQSNAVASSGESYFSSTAVIAVILIAGGVAVLMLRKASLAED